MNDSSTSKSLSFPHAIAQTQALMVQIESNGISEAEIKQQISSLLESKNGGRGFFVAYLTSEMPLADSPSPGVISGLSAAQEFSSELLVKNLAMSSAMTVVHDRNSDPESLAGSEKVCRRTCNLIQKLNLQAIEEKLQQLISTLENGQGEYQDFLQRWNYDAEQKKAIQNAIKDL